MITAKEFLDNKQDKHFEKFGVYADVNSKIAEWMEEYANAICNEGKTGEGMDLVRSLNKSFNKSIRHGRF